MLPIGTVFVHTTFSQLAWDPYTNHPSDFISFPEIEINVVNAAPFKPLSSFNTWTKITWLGFITSWILYFFEGNFFSTIFFSKSPSVGVWSKGSWLFISWPLLLMIFSSFFSLYFKSSSLVLSCSCLILSKSLCGNWK